MVLKIIKNMWENTLLIPGESALGIKKKDRRILGRAAAKLSEEKYQKRLKTAESKLAVLWVTAKTSPRALIQSRQTRRKRIMETICNDHTHTWQYTYNDRY